MSAIAAHPGVGGPTYTIRLADSGLEVKFRLVALICTSLKLPSIFKGVRDCVPVTQHQIGDDHHVLHISIGHTEVAASDCISDRRKSKSMRITK